MAEVLCGGTIWSESEFTTNETHFNKCGENMQAMLQSWATQKYRSTTDVYNAMRKANRCDVDGTSTMGQQVAQAKADGFKVDYLATDTSMDENDWRAFLFNHLPNEAVGIEVANGQALKDELSGLGEDATNLKYHFITIFGHHDGGVSPHAGKTLPAGWWAADGDSYVNNTHSSSGWNRHLGGHTLCFYSEETLRAAKPCAALAMYPKATIPTGETQMGVPSGWTDDGTTLTAPNGKVVVHGFRDWVLTHNWDRHNVPEANEQTVSQCVLSNPVHGAGVVQFFRDCQLSWTQKENVWLVYTGNEAMYLRAQHDALTAQVTALQTQLANALASLQQAQDGQGELSQQDASLLTLIKSEAARQLIPQLASALAADQE